MQRQRGELVPIGEVVPGLDDVAVPAIRDASPQARHHFTLADQVDQLVMASEADPDLGFMVRMMALCSLPRTNPGKLFFSTSASTARTNSSCTQAVKPNSLLVTSPACSCLGFRPRPSKLSLPCWF